MKIEPRKIKKTLKYAAAGVCTVTSLIACGCEEVELDGDIASTPMASVNNLPAESTPELNGVSVSTPAPTMQNLPNLENMPEPEDLALSGDIAANPTPELAGGIPAPYDEDGEEKTELELAGETAFYFDEE